MAKHRTALFGCIAVAVCCWNAKVQATGRTKLIGQRSGQRATLHLKSEQLEIVRDIGPLHPGERFTSMSAVVHDGRNYFGQNLRKVGVREGEQIIYAMPESAHGIQFNKISVQDFHAQRPDAVKQAAPFLVHRISGVAQQQFRAINAKLTHEAPKILIKEVRLDAAERPNHLIVAVHGEVIPFRKQTTSFGEHVFSFQIELDPKEFVAKGPQQPDVVEPGVATSADLRESPLYRMYLPSSVEAHE